MQSVDPTPSGSAVGPRFEEDLANGLTACPLRWHLKNCWQCRFKRLRRGRHRCCNGGRTPWISLTCCPLLCALCLCVGFLTGRAPS